jgi:CRP-like cAMP-binding protein
VATKGMTLVREGDVGNDAYVILEGEAAVSRNGRRIGDLGPGDAFGELALLSNGTRIATVRATSDMQLLVFDRDALERAVLDSPTLAMRLLEQLAARLREADRRAFG